MAYGYESSCNQLAVNTTKMDGPAIATSKDIIVNFGAFGDTLWISRLCPCMSKHFLHPKPRFMGVST